MSSFIFLGLGGNIPFKLVDTEFVHYHILKTLIEKSLLGPGINKGIGLLFVQNSMELMEQGVPFIRIERLAGLFD